MHPTTTGRFLSCFLAAALAVGLLLAGASPAEAQDPMAPLMDMVGEWSGAGWMLSQDGQRVSFDSSEVVEARLDGAALIIEGLHHAKDTGQIVHHALALLTWDASAEIYRFRSQVAGRGPGDFTGHMDGDTFVWGGPMGPGQMRYRIDISDDTWHEIGEYSTDGESWRQFFQMDLKRVR